VFTYIFKKVLGHSKQERYRSVLPQAESDMKCIHSCSTDNFRNSWKESTKRQVPLCEEIKIWAKRVFYYVVWKLTFFPLMSIIFVALRIGLILIGLGGKKELRI